MPDVFLTVLGLVLFTAFGALGRYMYLYPQRAMEKFNPYGKPYGKFFTTQTQVFGVAIVLGCVFVTLGKFLGPLLRLIPAPEAVLTIGLLGVSGVITWQILTRTRSQTSLK